MTTPEPADAPLQAWIDERARPAASPGAPPQDQEDATLASLLVALEQAAPPPMSDADAIAVLREVSSRIARSRMRSAYKRTLIRAAALVLAAAGLSLWVSRSARSPRPADTPGKVLMKEVRFESLGGRKPVLFELRVYRTAAPDEGKAGR